MYDSRTTAKPVCDVGVGDQLDLVGDIIADYHRDNRQFKEDWYTVSEIHRVGATLTLVLNEGEYRFAFQFNHLVRVVM